jgi:site-specific DNA-methyltransferase (cytosine-N4-specific)
MSASWDTVIPNAEYVSRWFEEPVLREIAAVAVAIEDLPGRCPRDVFRVILSDILRDFSHHDPSDLRIRRRKDEPPAAGAINRFIDDMDQKIGDILEAREVVGTRTVTAAAFRGDARAAIGCLRQGLGGQMPHHMDAAITSPPYATALPYVDTNRLSMCVLGLLDAGDLRTAGRELIGNREINKGERKRYELALANNDANLPVEVLEVCQDLLVAADHKDHGFRRRNKPALLYKYLSEMAETFDAVRKLLRQGGRYALVVGNNTTRLRGKVRVINTPELLALIGEARGWHLEEVTTLDTYPRYDIHQRNSIETERLLLFQA